MAAAIRLARSRRAPDRRDRHGRQCRRGRSSQAARRLARRSACRSRPACRAPAGDRATSGSATVGFLRARQDRRPIGRARRHEPAPEAPGRHVREAANDILAAGGGGDGEARRVMVQGLDGAPVGERRTMGAGKPPTAAWTLSPRARRSPPQECSGPDHARAPPATGVPGPRRARVERLRARSAPDREVPQSRPRIRGGGDRKTIAPSAREPATIGSAASRLPRRRSDLGGLSG